MRRALVAGLAFGLVLPLAAAANDGGDETPASIRFQPPGHVKPLRFGMLLTGQIDVGPDHANGQNTGFRASDARLLVEGHLEEGFSYLLQSEFRRDTPLLDLILRWESEGGTMLHAGYFRTPTSGELLIAAPDLDFIDRAQIVRTLAADRQVGLQIDQPILGRALVARAGVFGGDGLDGGDDKKFLYTGRVDGVVTCDDGETEFAYGASAFHSRDEEAVPGFAAIVGPGLQADRTVAGADVRVTHGPFLFSAEGMWGALDSFDVPDQEIWGYQGSVGWTINRLIQVLARYDSLHGEGAVSDLDLAIGSLVLNFTDYVNLQAEIRVPTRGEGPVPGGAANLNIQF